MRNQMVMAVLAALLVAGCDRRIEPFDPDEQVEAPDLSKIFPEGARLVEERERADDAAPGPAGGAPPSPAGGRGAPPVVAEGAAIRGRLELADALEGQVPRGGVLFLVARSPSGGPPVAVKRIQDPTFPMDFELGPDDRMIQAIPFEGPLVLTARVDGDGNATSREPGDLSGMADAPVSPGDTGITIRIDEKL